MLLPGYTVDHRSTSALFQTHFYRLVLHHGYFNVWVISMSKAKDNGADESSD